MNGGVSSLTLRRYAGRVRWETVTRYAESGTELNDLGFVTLVNDVMFRNQVSVLSVRPTSWYRRANAVLSQELHWTTGGLRTGASGQAHAAAEFTNFWGASVTYNLSNYGGTLCVTCARGGPLLRVSPYQRISFTLDGDARKAIAPSFEFRVAGGDEGRSWAVAGEAGLDGRVGNRTSFEVGVEYERRSDDTQPVRNFGATFSDTTHYTFAALAQDILGITMRGGALHVDPCIPRDWPGFEAVLTRDGATYRIAVENPNGVSRGVRSIELDGEPVTGDIAILQDKREHVVRIVMGTV
jgi:hypothetical protein